MCLHRFSTSIHGLSDGHGIRIVAIPKRDATKFAVNLRRGDDVYFHFNPRFNQGTVVMNCEIGGAWQQEEYIDPIPFTPGKLFTLDLVSINGSVEIVIDGEQRGRFRMREDLRNVDRFEVDGDVDIHSVHYGV
uniref:Galectin n=1 Tax=Ascaris suum TaxID=6253 RepID=F1LFS8_ASCSU